MQLKRIKIENFKKLEDLNSNIDGNIIYVKGGNEKGKTTFTNAVVSLLNAKLDVDSPVTTGKDEGSLEGVFEAPNGEKYTVQIEFENDKSKVKIAFPNGKISRKVTEIRDIFNYNSFSPEEFVAKSKSAEGRRWQRDQVLKLLPDEIQKSFRKAMEEEKEAFDQRRELKRNADAYEKMIQSEKPSDEEKQMAKEADKYQEEMAKAEDNLNEKKIHKDNVDKINDELDRAKTSFGTRRGAIDDTIDQIDNQIKALRESRIKKENELETLKMNYAGYKNRKEEELNALGKFNEEEYATAEKAVEATRIKFNKINEALKRVDSFTKKKNELDKYTSLIKKEDTKLRNTREEKELLVQKNKLPVEGLEITSDGLSINGLPFNKNQISTSKIMEIAISVLIEMNQKAPIIVVGRAESLDPESLEKIVEQATKNNCQIFIDKVEKGDFQLEFEERINYDSKPKKSTDIQKVEAPPKSKEEKERKLPDFSNQLNQMESPDTGNTGKEDDFSNFNF
jgi:chromosome segregation ATPase